MVDWHWVVTRQRPKRIHAAESNDDHADGNKQLERPHEHHPCCAGGNSRFPKHPLPGSSRGLLLSGRGRERRGFGPYAPVALVKDHVGRVELNGIMSCFCVLRGHGGVGRGLRD